MTSENLKSILRAFMEQVWNNGNLSRIEDYVAPMYKIKHDPGDPWDGQILNIDIFKERVLYSRNAMPDLKFEIQEMIGENEKVAVSWIMSGTHKGDLPQLSASGKPFLISGITLYDFEEGKVCGHWQAFDRLGFLAQIGYLNQ